MAMTLHSTGVAFRRYFQTAGEDLRKLLAGRKTLVNAGPPLAHNSGEGKSSYVLKFTK